MWRFKGRKYLVPLIFCLALLHQNVKGRDANVPQGKINPKIDYLAKCNELSRPDNFDPNLNAKPYLDKAFKSLTKESEEIKKSLKLWPQDLDESQRALWRTWLDDNSETLIHLHKAASYPYYWSQYKSVDGTVSGIRMEELSSFRQASYLLRAESKLYAMKGRFSVSFNSLRDTYKLGTFLNGKKTVVEQLVEIAIKAMVADTAIQILSNTNPSESVLADFQMEIEKLIDQSSFRMDFSLERIMFDEAMQMSFVNDGNDGGYLVRHKHYEDILDGDWRRISLNETIELTNKVFAYADQMAKKTPAQLNAEYIDIDAEINKMISSNPFVKTFTLAYGQVHPMSYRCQAESDALILILALQRYKAKTGQYPNSLDDLVKEKYIKQVPIDPFSDKPFVYKKTENDFILYSFAHDCDDDNGKHIKWSTDGDGDYVFWPMQKD